MIEASLKAGAFARFSNIHQAVEYTRILTNPNRRAFICTLFINSSISLMNLQCPQNTNNMAHIGMIDIPYSSIDHKENSPSRVRVQNTQGSDSGQVLVQIHFLQ